MFILFEGIVGTGKTTHLHRLSAYLSKKDIPNEVFKSRDSAQLGMVGCPKCNEEVPVDVREMQTNPIPKYLAFLGSITYLNSKILKTESQGMWSVVDRYIYTQMAYTRKFNPGWIDSMNDIVKNNIVKPDITFWLTGDIDWLVKNRPGFKFSGFSVADLKDLNEYYGESLPVSATYRIDVTKKTPDQTFQEIRTIVIPYMEKSQCSSTLRKLSKQIILKGSKKVKSEQHPST